MKVSLVGKLDSREEKLFCKSYPLNFLSGGWRVVGIPIWVRLSSVTLELVWLVPSKQKVSTDRSFAKKSLIIIIVSCHSANLDRELWLSLIEEIKIPSSSLQIFFINLYFNEFFSKTIYNNCFYLIP